jgi:DNA-binding NarL/FixJ family response regulator
MSQAQTFTAGSDAMSKTGSLTMPTLCSPLLAPFYRVLIVDDVASTRRIVGAALESTQQFCVVGEASDGRGAIEMSAALAPDLVLLDVSMPFVDGTKALQGVRQAAPNAKVVIFSSVKPAKAEQLVDGGAVGFIEKGITPFELLERLGEILSRPSEAVLDPDVFDELRVLVGSSGKDLLQELVIQFVHDTEEWLVQLRQALEGRDVSAVSQISHRIKGGADQLGGRRLALSCSRLEDTAAEGSLSDCRTYLSAVEHDYLELRRALTA